MGTYEGIPRFYGFPPLKKVPYFALDEKGTGAVTGPTFMDMRFGMAWDNEIKKGWEGYLMADGRTFKSERGDTIRKKHLKTLWSTYNGIVPDEDDGGAATDDTDNSSPGIKQEESVDADMTLIATSARTNCDGLEGLASLPSERDRGGEASISVPARNDRLDVSQRLDHLQTPNSCNYAGRLKIVTIDDDNVQDANNKPYLTTSNSSSSLSTYEWRPKDLTPSELFAIGDLDPRDPGQLEAIMDDFIRDGWTPPSRSTLLAAYAEWTKGLDLTRTKAWQSNPPTKRRVQSSVSTKAIEQRLTTHSPVPSSSSTTSKSANVHIIDLTSPSEGPHVQKGKRKFPVSHIARSLLERLNH